MTKETAWAEMKSAAKDVTLMIDTSPVAWANRIALGGINARATTPVWLSLSRIPGHDFPLFDQAAMDAAERKGFERAASISHAAIVESLKPYEQEKT